MHVTHRPLGAVVFPQDPERSPITIVLSVQERLAFGAYADIFLRGSDADSRVIKLFRRKGRDPEGRAVRALFRAEASAFEKAHAVPELSKIVATYFGPCTVAQVRGSVHDLTRFYHLDCCYALERLEGKEYKLTGYREYEWVRSMLLRFTAHGIGYAEDASLFERPDGTFKLIDIATHDAAAVHHSLLFDRSGSLHWDVPEGPGDPLVKS